MRCAHGFDADAILSAVQGDRSRADEHLAHCDRCAELVRVHTRARNAWKAALVHDDATTRGPSELRLVHGIPREQRARAPVFVFGAAAGAFAVVVAMLLVRHREPVAVATAPAASATSAVTADPIATAPAPAMPAPARKLVTTDSCETCRVNGARVEPGTAVDGARLTVPAGARMTLAFALPSGLVDAAAGADVSGPATTTVSGGEITIERGDVRLRGAKDVVVVVPGARVVSTVATFAVHVGDRGTTSLAVELGKVFVTRPGEGTVTVDAGGTYQIAERAESPKAIAVVDSVAHAPPPAVVQAPAARPEDLRASALAGDATAREALERIASGPDERAARRATFMLAELDLAAGGVVRARERLNTLLAAGDPALGYDAATLLARSHTAPSERAAIWGRYLSTAPAAPYSTRALLARSEALLDGGQKAEAERIMREVERTPGLGESEQRQLVRLLVKARDAR